MRVPQRGRAILRRLSAQDAVRAFRPGDFVLTTSDGGMARLLGWATGGELNHAAIIIDPLGTVVEANPTFLADTRAFRTCSVAEYLRAGRPCWIGYVELREGTRQDVVAYAEHLLRARGTISLAGRIWMALHTLLSIAPRALASRYAGLRGMRDVLEGHAVVLREEHCYAAAEFVARALERGGFIWDRDPAHVTPAELFRRYHLAEPAPVTPMPIARMRHRRPASTSGVTGTERRGAITPFAPRGVQGATALAELPHDQEAPQKGLHALLQVGALAAAGLMVIGMLEELIHLAAREG
jgi:hypothetical protein